MGHVLISTTFFLAFSVFQAAQAGGRVIDDESILRPSHRVMMDDHEEWATSELNPYILDPTDPIELYELEVLNRLEEALFCPLSWYAPFYKNLDRDDQDDFSLTPPELPLNTQRLNVPVVSACTLHGGRLPLHVRLVHMPQTVVSDTPLQDAPAPISLGFFRSPLSLGDTTSWFGAQKPPRLFFQECDLRATHLDTLASLGQNPTHLRLRHNFIKQKDERGPWSTSLFSLISQNPRLSHLALDHVSLSASFMKKFASFFVETRTLTHLRLRTASPLENAFLKQIEAGLGETKVMHISSCRKSLVVRPSDQGFAMRKLGAFVRLYMRYASALR
ncbi:MAG: hypothetical protein C0514_04400 [Candidatus Puniceispirillum sp.]|nr:hypothetical protein [Candidatus Puniceispirillum sp.]